MIDTSYPDADALPCAAKLAFDSRREAEGSAGYVLHTYGTQVHAYCCRFCGLWHLSSSAE